MVAAAAVFALADRTGGTVNGRVLGVDPGEKRLGIAISDPSGTIAGPLTVVKHVARAVDAARIARLAAEQGAVLIVVGQPLDAEGEVGPQGRKSLRLAEAIRSCTDLPVELWDESGSTQAVIEARRAMGAKRKKRSGHLDDLAATFLLQAWLDQHE
jgi:putative Holliday junction resolvase